MKLNKKRLKALIRQNLKQINEDNPLDVAYKFYAKKFNQMTNELKQETHAYIEETVTDYIKNNAKSMSQAAPLPGFAQEILENGLMETKEKIGKCAADIIFEYFELTQP